MNITVTSRHDPGDRRVVEHARTRVARVARLFHRLEEARVVLDREGGSWTVETVVGAPRGARFAARAADRNLHAAVDAMASRLEAQLREWKARLVEHRPDPPTAPGGRLS